MFTRARTTLAFMSTREDVDARPFTRRLRDAHGFIEVALATCCAAREQQLCCAVTLLTRRGLPLITVEHLDAIEKPFAYAAQISVLTERLGLIRWSACQPIENLGEVMLATAANVAVRLAQLGHTSGLDITDQLTPRQIETASLAARGHTNTEIADRLGVSGNTVKKHLADVFERLHVAGRAELALQFAWLATLDLVPAGVTLVGDCRITRIV
jgi:DNA-binding CsgD family transcriptional regulator